MTRLFIDALLVMAALSLWIGRGIDLGVVNLQAVDIAGFVLIVLVLFGRAGLSRKNASLPIRGGVTLLFYAVVASCLLIILAAMLSVVNAVDRPAIARFAFRYLLGLGLLGILFFCLRPRYRITMVSRTLVIGAVGSVAISAVGFFVSAVGTVTVRYGDRAQGLLNHPNQLAMLLLATLPIALAFALRKPRRLLPWLGVFVVAGGVAITGSKLNIVLVLFAIASFFALANRFSRSAVKRLLFAITTPFLLALVVVAVYQAVSYFNPRTLDTLLRLLVDPLRVTAVSSRMEMWSVALSTGAEYVWTGVGANNASFYIPYDHAHNVFIDFFLSMGVFGVLALSMLLLSVFSLSGISLFKSLTDRSLPRLDRLLLIAFPLSCLLYIAANQSSDSFGGTTLPVFWVCTALMVAQLLGISRWSPQSGRPASVAEDE